MILTLRLKKKWFDMIASGEKKEEYREYTDYWHKRLAGKPYTHVVFINGYAKDSRRIIKQIEYIRFDIGRPEWGAVENKTYWVIKLQEGK